VGDGLRLRTEAFRGLLQRLADGGDIGPASAWEDFLRTVPPTLAAAGGGGGGGRREGVRARDRAAGWGQDSYTPRMESHLS